MIDNKRLVLALAWLSLGTHVSAGKPVVITLTQATEQTPKSPEEIVAEKYKFSGQYVVSKGRNTNSVDNIPIRQREKLHKGERLWRWASVTKQVIAVIVMQEVAKGRIDLDAPLNRYLPGFKSANASKISVRQLLRHQSGLPNPDNVAASSINGSAFYFPFYRGNRDPMTGYCAGQPKGEPGGKWEYNNCDYLVAGALLKVVTGKSWQSLVEERIAKPLKLTSLKAFPTKEVTVSGKIGTAKEPPFDLATFGAAGGLYGTATDMVRFSTALLNGELLPQKERAEMWDGRPELGFMALGQWVFEARLEGCDAPVKIVERRGAIGGVQVRNFILPDQKIAAVAFSNQGNFDFGEIWQGAGFSYEYLSTVACL